MNSSNRFTFSSSVTGFSLAFGLLLTACGLKPSELKFDDSVLASRRPASQSIEVQPLIENRRATESVFLRVLGMPQASIFQATNSTGMASTIENSIYRKKEFGGACDRYAASEMPNGTGVSVEFPRETCPNEINVVQRPNSNPQRYSHSTKLCESIASNDSQMLGILNRTLGGSSTSLSAVPPPSSESIRKLYQQFYTSQAPSSELDAYLVNLAAQVSSPAEAWRQLFLIVCVSPEWQTVPMGP